MAEQRTEKQEYNEAKGKLLPNKELTMNVQSGADHLHKDNAQNIKCDFQRKHTWDWLHGEKGGFKQASIPFFKFK